MSAEWRGSSQHVLFLFFFFLEGVGDYKWGAEKACLGKLLMQACFNLHFPDSDIIGNESEEQPTGIDLKSAASAAKPREPN